MNSEVKITASNLDEGYETQLATLRRINTVVGLLRDNGHIPTEIKALHEHNGTLTVTWAQQPGLGEKEFLKELWREVSTWEVVHLVEE